MVDEDQTDGQYQCYLLSDVVSVAKLGYYAGKLFQILRTLPPPG